MARRLKPACKLSRRVCVDLSLKNINNRNISSKCNFKTLPGQHSGKRKRTNNGYFYQLIAKQTIKFMYGILEKQFKNFLSKVSGRKGATGEFLLQLLESRLDNVVYRIGFATTRAEARQLVSHKSISIIRNGVEKNISFPSYIVKSGDIIKVKNKSKNQIRIQYALKCAEKNGFANWIKVDTIEMSAIFLRTPERNELSNELNEQLMIEFYSR